MMFILVNDGKFGVKQTLMQSMFQGGINVIDSSLRLSEM